MQLSFILGVAVMLQAFASEPSLTAGISSEVVQQQGRTITGVVSDDSGPIIGANVLVKGTTNGAVTNIDGQFTISNVPNNAVLQVSFIGYIAQEVTVGTQTRYDVKLTEDSGVLEEVVVVGYGVQARRDISGSIVTVSAEELKEIPVATFAEALMGMAAGVYVSSTGAPGSATTMRIRGVGSVNASNAGPLVIVDGISNVDINTINPNDIENLSILKDASATAIYGARGANGVILITTKQGSRTGRVRVTYDGYVGLSTMANDGYDVLNAWEAMEFQAQGMINRRDIKGLSAGAHAQFGTLNANDQLTMPYATKPAGFSQAQVIERWGSLDNFVASYRPDGTNSWALSAYYEKLALGYSEAEARKGTDWYGLIVQKGLMHNHNLNLQGGNGDRGQYSISLGITSQEGTIKSSFYDRYTLRANSIFHPSKYLSFGFNVNMSAQQQGGDRGGNSEGGPFGRVLTTQSWVPMYNVGGDFGGSQSAEGGRNQTPLSTVHNQSLDTDRSFRTQASIYAELKPIDGLVIKTQYAPSLNGTWSTSFSPITIMYDKEGSANNSYNETAAHNMSWQWTNTASYTTKFNVDHKLDVVIGSEALNNNVIGTTSLSATRRYYLFPDDRNTWTINNGSTADISNGGGRATHTSMFGYFGRVEYGYKGTYIITASVRRDASSSFAPKKRWGTFPSASLAWRVSDENFMKPLRKYIDDMKFRIGYGTSGSSASGYNWAFEYATGAGYSYNMVGNNTSLFSGYGVSSLGDDKAQWETVRTLNVGIDVLAFKQRLNTSIEWFTRQTADMLVSANWSALAGGATKPRINIGDMSNKGVDFSISWRDRNRVLSYNISANISTYRNKIVKLGSSNIFSTSRLGNISITTTGEPIGMFYGYTVKGIYKSEEDVFNYKTNGEVVVPYGAADRESLYLVDTETGKRYANNWMGRYIIEDRNNDGVIDEYDRGIIGDPNPDFTGGLNASITYRSFDLSANFYFSVGNDLYKMWMYFSHYGALQANYSKDRRDNSWHPVTNPDGKYPLWATATNEGDEAGNVSNSMYIQDGSYLRMRNLTLGYSLPRNIVRKTGLERVRLYAQISNLFTLTKYPGLDPEVRGAGTNNIGTDTGRGIDYGPYAQPRQFILGLNISFQ